MGYWILGPYADFTLFIIFLESIFCVMKPRYNNVIILINFDVLSELHMRIMILQLFYIISFDSFSLYSTDTFHIQDYDIGYVTGMEISRDEAGFFPNWKLDKV